MALKLKRVQRLDSISLDATYFTDEGYLIDHPIVTSTGIFEYTKPDGSVRRELRLPEEVFKPESLSSYKGKPIIITHNAGYVDKDNVDNETIGTILSDGYQDGDNVRAEIIIHDTDAMKKSGLRELSLGYNLNLDETPGVWNGQPYDAVQRDIVINHLALVGEARAGEQARLNVDGKDEVTLKGEKSMGDEDKKAVVANMTPDELSAAIEAFKKRRQERMALPVETTNEDEPTPAPVEQGPTNESAEPDINGEDRLQMVKNRRDKRDKEGDPKDMNGAMGIIARQDEDIDTLLGIIDVLKAAGICKDEDDVPNDTDDSDEPQTDEGDSNSKNSTDAGDEATAVTDENTTAKKNADRKDAADEFRELLRVVRVGDRLNMDGLESMSIKGAKKTVLKKLKPTLNLDGKSMAYVNAAFDMAVGEMNTRKDISFQRKQMVNHDGEPAAKAVGSAMEARQKMINRRMKKED